MYIKHASASCLKISLVGQNKSEKIEKHMEWIKEQEEVEKHNYDIQI